MLITSTVEICIQQLRRVEEMVLAKRLLVFGHLLRGGKRWGRDILHACWPTIRARLVPFWRSKVKVTRDKNRLALRSPTRLPYEWYARAANGYCCGAGGRAHFVAGEG